MLIPFERSERLDKLLAAYYVNDLAYEHFASKVKGYRAGEEDPYYLLQMGADLAEQLSSSDGYSNGNKIWHLRCNEDNWFIPAKDEQEIEEILKELLFWRGRGIGRPWANILRP